MLHKKLLLSLLLSTSSMVFAGAMGDVATSPQGFGVGANALYLQATNSPSGLNYAINSRSTGNFINYPDNWNWGFELEGFYRKGANDIDLNWYRVHGSNTNRVSGSFVNTFDDDFPLVNANATVGKIPQWDQVNLEFGHQLPMMEHAVLRFHGGFEYGRVSTTTSLSVNSNVTSFAGYKNQAASYNGFGPRGGLDLNYAVWKELSVYSDLSASVLAGSSRLKQIVTDTVGSDTNGMLQASSLTTVPELDLKLGVNYQYHVFDESLLTADFGWLWVNYINALSAFDDKGRRVNVSSFSLQGLYFGLKLQGNL